jgi:hypothetical protein
MTSETRVPDIVRSLTWIFEDPNWIQKYVIGAVLSLIPIVNFMPTGYSLLVMKDALEGEPPKLRDWDGIWGETFVLGLKAIVLVFLYGLLFLVIIGVLALLHAWLAAAALGLLLVVVLLIIAPLALARMILADSFAAGLAFTEILGDLQRAGGPYFLTWAINLGIVIALTIVTGIPFLGMLIALAGGFALSLWVSVLWGRVCGPILRPTAAPGTPSPIQPA